VSLGQIAARKQRPHLVEQPSSHHLRKALLERAVEASTVAVERHQRHHAELTRQRRSGPKLQCGNPLARRRVHLECPLDALCVVRVNACRSRGVAVTNTPGVLTNATAELALALTLAAARLTNSAEAELRRGRWRGWDPGDMLGLELSGATFGVVGLGRIGSRYAELVSGFGGRTLYVAPAPKAEAEKALGASRVSLEELLAESDVVSLHAPATAETEHMISTAELDAMKTHAVLVNTSRGSLVDSEALAKALADSVIGAAGLDVYEHEPGVPQHLLDAPRCVLLPHVGSATTKARDAMAALVADNVLVPGLGHMSLPAAAQVARTVSRALAHLDPDGTHSDIEGTLPDIDCA